MIPVSYHPVRRCNDCREIKSEEEFSTVGKYRKGHCKRCDVKRTKKYQMAKKERGE